jgi:hypothetical protein
MATTCSSYGVSPRSVLWKVPGWFKPARLGVTEVGILLAPTVR